jgi:hypothetical protein
MDRASVCGTEGRRFESFWSHCFFTVIITPGEMSEWSKETDSKSVVSFTVPRVRIPLSPIAWIILWCQIDNQFVRLERCPSGRWCTLGKRVCWKAPGVRIPPSPYFFPADRFCAMCIHPTPSGPEGSSGKWTMHETQAICWLGFIFVGSASLFSAGTYGGQHL